MTVALWIAWASCIALVLAIVYLQLPRHWRKKRDPMLLEVRFELRTAQTVQQFVMGVRDSLVIGGQGSHTVKLKRVTLDRLVLTVSESQPTAPLGGTTFEVGETSGAEAGAAAGAAQAGRPWGVAGDPRRWPGGVTDADLDRPVEPPPGGLQYGVPEPSREDSPVAAPEAHLPTSGEASSPEVATEPAPPPAPPSRRKTRANPAYVGRRRPKES